ncbi:GNAT family N-acetyltransferase [Pseudochryseolinea flava]|uniref:GNAT family N-acetyltransferase n=1 Tax=Pseudochryseolinea flava TaxID=2059302 RepID=A0A364XYZ9_9BACT|nr:GNAT family N-acetyltransferase [Pseudochryseolinea flava]RAV99528.1 GNAT family N-acetyltransferase [Pseudochryseolinea flava]
MNDVVIRNAGPADIPIIQELAELIWWPTYSPIVAPEQIRFMLDLIYSSAALEKVMQEGTQRFLLLQDDNGYQGFAAFGVRAEDDTIFKLHKLYIDTRNQGKGYGKMLINEIKTRLRQNGIRTLDLNVNRHNKAKSFYEKLGFVVIKEEDVSIGPYWMNDFVMRLTF